MVRVGGFLKSQNRIRRQRARGRFISPYQVGGTIFGKSTMARYPLMHTSSRLLEPWMLTQRQRRKMKGGTIFGTSTRMRMGDPMKVLSAAQEKAMMDRWIKQRMKGGTIFGKSTRMRMRNPLRFPSATQESDRMERWIKQRMKGGNLFKKLKKRIQIDFPHRPFPSAHPISDGYRLRKGIKRRRR